MHEIFKPVRLLPAKLRCGVRSGAVVLDHFPFYRLGATRCREAAGAADSGCLDSGSASAKPNDHVGAYTLASSDQGSGTGVDAPRSDGRASAINRGESAAVFGIRDQRFLLHRFRSLPRTFQASGKLGLRAKQADREAEAARDAYLVQQREVVEQVRETYFNLFYLREMVDSLHWTQSELDRVAQTTEAQYHVAMAQQQDVLKAQLAQIDVLKDEEMNQEEFQQGQANLKGILGREQDSPNIEVGKVTPTTLSISDSRLRQLALANSPTLQQAHAMEEQSDAALAIAKRDYVPDFNVAYMYQKTGPGLRDYYMLSLGVKIPLYFWRRQTPAVEQASLEKESILADSTRNGCRCSPAWKMKSSLCEPATASSSFTARA